MADNKIVEIVYQLVDKVSGTAKAVKGSLDDVTKSAGGAGEGVEKSGESAKKASTNWIGFSAAMGGVYLSLKKVVTGAVSAAIEYEQQEAALTSMTGSAIRAQKILGDVAKAAAKTPFERKELVEYAKQLYATGTAQKDLIPTMMILGDVAAGVGTEKLPRIVNAFTQIQSKGRLMGDDLKDLTNNTVPIIGELADMLGVVPAQIRDMASEGKITADMVTEAFRRMTSEGGRFHDMQQKQSETTGGKLSNLADAVGVLALKLGEPLRGPLSKIVTLLIAVTEKIGQINPVFAVFVSTAAGAIMVVTGLATAFGLVALALGGVKVALIALAGTTGLGLLVGAIAATVYWVSKHTSEMKVAFLNLKIGVLTIIKGIIDAINNIPKALSDAVLGMKKALKNIPGFKNIDTSSQHTSKQVISTEGVDNSITEAKKQLEGIAAEQEKARKAKDKAEADAKAKEKAESEKLAKDKADALAMSNAEQAAEEKKVADKLAAEQAARDKTTTERRIQERELLFEREKALRDVSIEEEIAFQMALLEIENLSAEQKTAIEDNIFRLKTARMVKEKEAKDAQGKEFVNIVKDVATQEVSIQEAVSQGLFKAKKDEIIASIDAEAARLAQVGAARLIASFGLDPMGYAHLAGAAALFAGGRAAVNAIKLADGGVVMPQPGGVPAVIGEGGKPEAVIPLDDSRAREALGGGQNNQRVIILTDDGKELAKGIYKKQTEMLRTGELSPRK